MNIRGLYNLWPIEPIQSTCQSHPTTSTHCWELILLLLCCLLRNCKNREIVIQSICTWLVGRVWLKRFTPCCCYYFKHYVKLPFSPLLHRIWAHGAPKGRLACSRKHPLAKADGKAIVRFRTWESAWGRPLLFWHSSRSKWAFTTRHGLFWE